MIQQYKIYFSIFGKKMRTEVEASSKKEAMEMVRQKILFHKVESEEETLFKSIPDNILDIFGIKRK